MAQQCIKQRKQQASAQACALATNQMKVSRIVNQYQFNTHCADSILFARLRAYALGVSATQVELWLRAYLAGTTC